MYSLYINTSGAYCELALLHQHQVVAHKLHETAMEHSTVLHSMITNLLTENKVTLKNISAIGVLNGPGSYTGLRIGLAAAKSFCYALNIPLFLFNKLELYCDYYQKIFPEKKLIACIENARADEFFFCMQLNGAQISPASVYSELDVLEILSNHSEHTIITPVHNFLSETIKPLPVQIEFGYIAIRIAEEVGSNNINDVFRSEPFYLKNVFINKPKKPFL